MTLWRPTGPQELALTVFCEDAESEYLITSLITAGAPTGVKRLRLVQVVPASTVQTLGGLIAQERMPDRSIGVLDADQQASPGCLLLPGEGSPERTAFQALTEAAWGNVAERLAVRHGDVLDAVEDTMRLEDAHTWPARLAERLGPGVRATRVWEAVADVWVRDVLEPSGRDAFVAEVVAALPDAAVTATSESSD